MWDDKPDSVSRLQAPPHLATNLLHNPCNGGDDDYDGDDNDSVEDGAHGEGGDGHLCHLGQVSLETVCTCLGCIGLPEHQSAGFIFDDHCD